MLSAINRGVVLSIISMISVGISADTDINTNTDTDTDVKVVVIPLGGDEAPKDKVIFITKDTYTANLGGLTGADAICQSDADAQGSKVKGEKFKAWLGGPVSDALAGGRPFNIYDTPYITPNGDLYAQSYSALISLPAWPFLSIAADGTDVTSPTGIDILWAGRASNGLVENTCTTWGTTTSGFGSIFLETTGSSELFLSSNPSVICGGSSKFRFICMQQ